VHVPVFYGLAHSVYVETEESLAEEEVRSTFLQAPGLLLAEALTAGSSGEAHYDEAPDPCPGPIEVSGSEAVHLARLRVFAEEGFGRLAFWLCLDDQRKGIALNLVSTLERALHRAAR
jgi:aspartate-semialdehyde dehydrogenase